jgi:hypothetical protein
MRSRLHLHHALSVLALGALSMMAIAEEPNANIAIAKPVTETVQIDRDGKKVCGWNLMNDSERGGYKNIMHQTKELADREAIRLDHCARMRTRATERGVPVEE